MKLVVRPKPYPTESLTGYLLRTSERNGYPNVAFLQELLRDESSPQMTLKLDASALMDLADISPVDAERLSLKPQKGNRAYIRIFGQELPAYEMALRAPKVCPQCLAEHGHCEAFWDLSQARACPIHRTQLISRCPDCSSPLRWSRSKLKRCPCGSDITTWHAQSASAALCDLMGVMRCQVYRGYVDLQCPTALTVLKNLDLRQLCKLTWVMSSTLHFAGEDKKHKPKSRLRYEVEAERVAMALASWPTGFQSLLQEMYGQTLSTAESQPPFHRCFSWVFDRLIKNDPDGGEAYRFVANEVFKFGANYWTQRALSRAGRDVNAPALDAIKWGTVSEAAEILGLHMLTMQKLIGAGEIPVRRVSPTGSRPFIVDLDWARRQRLTREPAIGIRDAAKVVGVSIETLRVMVSKGVYVAAHRSAFPGSLSGEDTRELAQRLGELLKGKKHCRNSDAISLDRLFFEAAASPEQKADTFAYLLDNPSLVIGKVPGSGMGVAQVQAEALKTVLPQLYDKPSLITLFESGQILGCTAAVVTSLRRLGYLKQTSYAGRVRILEVSVRQFGSAYESVASICRRLGVSTLNSYKRNDFSKLKHVKARAQGHSYTVFIGRSSVTAAEKMLARKCS